MSFREEDKENLALLLTSKSVYSCQTIRPVKKKRTLEPDGDEKQTNSPLSQRYIMKFHQYRCFIRAVSILRKTIRCFGISENHFTTVFLSAVTLFLQLMCETDSSVLCKALPSGLLLKTNACHGSECICISYSVFFVVISDKHTQLN